MQCFTSSSTLLKTAAERHDAAIRVAVLRKIFSSYFSSLVSVSNSVPAWRISPDAKSLITWLMSLITSRFSRWARCQEDCAKR